MQTVTGNSGTGISRTVLADDDVAGHSFHIGRRHVHAPDGTPAVIDWRAPVARPFYPASATDPMNPGRPPRLGVSRGGPTAHEGQLFAEAGAGAGAPGPDPSGPSAATPPDP